jgi:hypothetical protein
MSESVDVIWKKGQGEMTDKAKYVVEAAQNELLLKTLNFQMTLLMLLSIILLKNLYL